MSHDLQVLLKEIATPDSDESPEVSDTDEYEVVSVFQDRIESGDQDKINGRESGEPRIPWMKEINKDKGSQSWIFEKYYNMCFCDKTPTVDRMTLSYRKRRSLNIEW